MYLCPHCNGFLRESDIMNGLCSICGKLFDKPIERNNLEGKFENVRNHPSQSEKVNIITYKFLYQGGHGDYIVTFSREGNNLIASCTCPAGIVKQYCKHRFALMNGECENVISENKDDISKIQGLLVGTDVEKALIDLANAEEVYEAIIKEAKKALIDKKKALAKAMAA